MAASKRIALIFDCDGTIAEDTTTRLLRYLRLAPSQFWAAVRKQEQQGWEPTLAFMSQLIMYAQEQKKKKGGKPITRRTFETVGQRIKVLRGIPSFFKQVKQFIDRKYGAHGVTLSIYIVSGGIEDIIRASTLNGRRGKKGDVDDIFGCRFFFDSDGAISFPKCAISFTEKTKLLFAINKGITSYELNRNPYSVNDHIPPHDRSVSFNNMIYIGDGPTDVPCMSFLKANVAEIFAVYTEPRQGIPKKTHDLARQGRFTRGPFRTDYRPGSDLRRALESELEGYAQRIISEAAASRQAAPRH
jgi:hypothetical protein